MTQHFSIEHQTQLRQQMDEGLELFIVEVVLRVLVFINPTDHADADRGLVEAFGVCASLLKGPAIFKGTVTPNHIVVPNPEPASFTVPPINLIPTNVHSRRGGRTVNDQPLDLAFDQ